MLLLFLECLLAEALELCAPAGDGFRTYGFESIEKMFSFFILALAEGGYSLISNFLNLFQFS